MDEVGQLTGYKVAKNAGYLVAIKILGGIPGGNYGASGGCDYVLCKECGIWGNDLCLFFTLGGDVHSLCLIAFICGVFTMC